MSFQNVLSAFFTEQELGFASRSRALRLEELEPRLPPAAAVTGAAAALAIDVAPNVTALPVTALVSSVTPGANGVTPVTAAVLTIQLGRTSILSGPAPRNAVTPVFEIGRTPATISPMWIELVGGSGQQPPAEPLPPHVLPNFPPRFSPAEGQSLESLGPTDEGDQPDQGAEPPVQESPEALDTLMADLFLVS